MEIAPTWLVRPVKEADTDALATLAPLAPRAALHTLPRTREEIVTAVERSVDSFAGNANLPGDEYYLLVLEAPDGRVLGSAAVRATASSQGTFFCFRNDVVHHASPALKMSTAVHVLAMCPDLTEHSQLMSFFAASLAQNVWAGSLLSRARLMLAATWPRRFSDRFFVSMGGWTDEHGSSPFWDAVGRKFFGRDLIEVERALLGSRTKIQVSAIMPQFAIYVPLLPRQARAVIGQMHADVAWPFDILTAEGFEADRYLDMFDGGPILDAHRSKLRTWAGSRSVIARIDNSAESFGERFIVSSATANGDFRCCVARGTVQADNVSVAITGAIADLLRIGHGDQVRIVAF